jgi:hypothetical protein
VVKTGNDQEIELQEIKIGVFQEIKIGVFQEIKSIPKLIRRSKVPFFMRSKVLIKY